jgi:hypothetical protein
MKSYGRAQARSVAAALAGVVVRAEGNEILPLRLICVAVS